MHTAGGTKPCTRRLVLKRRGGGGWGSSTFAESASLPLLHHRVQARCNLLPWPAARAPRSAPPPPARPPATTAIGRDQDAGLQMLPTHSIPEHDVHTKVPTVTSVYVTPGWLHSKQCLFTPDWASSRTLRAQISWLSRCLRFDIVDPEEGRGAGCGVRAARASVRAPSFRALRLGHFTAALWGGGVGCGVCGGEGRRGGQGSRDAGWCLERAPLRSRLAPNARKLDCVGCDAYRKRADVRQNKSVLAD